MLETELKKKLNLYAGDKAKTSYLEAQGYRSLSLPKEGLRAKPFLDHPHAALRAASYSVLNIQPLEKSRLAVLGRHSDIGPALLATWKNFNSKAPNFYARHRMSHAA